MKITSKDGVVSSGLVRRSRWYYFKSNCPLILLTLPGLALLILFRYLPMFGMILPFKNYDPSLGFFKSEWCGFENFKYLFQGSGAMRATLNTILYNGAFIVIGTILQIILALMLYELSAKFVKGYQTVLIMPYFVSWVVGAYIVKALFDMDYGSVNRIIESLGGTPKMWYNEPKYWPAIIITANMWKNIGYGCIMYYAALMGVSPDYFEAAKIDGAGKLKQIWYVSIPMIKNTIIVLFILNVGKIMFADFGLFYNVPMNVSLLYPTTDVLDTFVYRALINLGDVGMSSAAAFYQSVIGFVLVVATNFIVKKFDSDSGLF